MVNFYPGNLFPSLGGKSIWLEPRCWVVSRHLMNPLLTVAFCNTLPTPHTHTLNIQSTEVWRVAGGKRRLSPPTPSNDGRRCWLAGREQRILPPNWAWGLKLLFGRRSSADGPKYDTGLIPWPKVLCSCAHHKSVKESYKHQLIYTYKYIYSIYSMYILYIHMSCWERVVVHQNQSHKNRFSLKNDRTDPNLNRFWHMDWLWTHFSWRLPAIN